MHVSVNGVRLFFDVEGAKFVPDGPVMRERPVLLMLRRFLQPEAPLDQEARDA
jgi:hypothetical protein